MQRAFKVKTLRDRGAFALPTKRTVGKLAENTACTRNVSPPHDRSMNQQGKVWAHLLLNILVGPLNDGSPSEKPKHRKVHHFQKYGFI